MIQGVFILWTRGLLLSYVIAHGFEFRFFFLICFSTFQVNLFLIVLDLSTLAHPANIWYQCRKHHHDSKALTLHRKSIHIFAKPANNDYITTDILEESNDVPLSRDLSIPNDLVLSNDYTETDTLVVPNGHKIVSDLATPNDTAEVQNDDVISTECQPLR